MICGLLAESPTPSIRSISKRLGLGYATNLRASIVANQDDPSPEPTHEEHKHHFLHGLLHRGD